MLKFDRWIFNHVDRSIEWFHSAGIHRNWVIRFLVATIIARFTWYMFQPDTGPLELSFLIILSILFAFGAYRDEVLFEKNREVHNTTKLFSRESVVGTSIRWFVVVLTVVFLPTQHILLAVSWILFAVFVYYDDSLMPSEPPSKIFEPKGVTA